MIIDLSELFKSLNRIESKIDNLSQASIPIPVPGPDPVVTPMPPLTFNWNEELKSGKIELQSGKSYYFPEYNTHTVTQNIEIFCNGECSVYFGKTNYSEWDEGIKQDRFLFFQDKMQFNVTIRNVNIYNASKVNEVQPFILTIFKNNPTKNQKGIYRLENVKTNCESAFLYSGQQEIQQSIECINVQFEGIIFEELKANNGGGLLSVKENCILKQIDPITNFKTNLKLISQDKVTSEISFNRIDNQFNSWGNSCNILFIDGFTFYLPKTEERGNTHSIRYIPEAGDLINIEVFSDRGVSYFRTNQVELQSGDVIEIDGFTYLLKVKDRSRIKFNQDDGFYIDFFSPNIDIIDGQYEATIKKSQAIDMIGKSFEGYMIFKYNKPFQTNMDIDHGLDYMLASNPFGVLCYNHEEISIDWKNTEFDGYYRQTRSGVGQSNKYTIENVNGLGNEFKKPFYLSQP